MKLNLLFVILILTQTLLAQTFIEATGTPFSGVGGSGAVFSDIDGDNDQDVLITGHLGMDDSFAHTSILYTNDGAGNFTEVTGTPFQNVAYGSIAFSDVDGDNDQDVLITGGESTSAYSILYINDGTGNFAQVSNAPFVGVYWSSIAFSDVDGDNDQDILITGQTEANGPTSKLYLNDGTGNFTEAIGTPFKNVADSSIAFSDVDGDNDEDVLITGLDDSNTRISELYLNDGAGNFTEVMDTLFVGVLQGSVAFADVDGDNDQDVIITGGADSSVGNVANLYLNDGAGNFTEATDTPFLGVSLSSVAFLDVDGDNDQDVFITGKNGISGVVSKLYINDGNGDFTEVMGLPFENVNWGSVNFSDVDGDNDQDVIITGLTTSFTPIAKLYINETEIVSSTDDLSGRLSFDFTLYPNPTKANRLNIKFGSTEIGLVRVKVFGLNGRLLSQDIVFSGIGQLTSSIDISSLATGSYIIELDDGKRKGSAKFIVH